MNEQLSQEKQKKQEARAVANMYGVMTNNPSPFINIINGITKINIAPHDYNDGRGIAIESSLQTLGIENSPTKRIDAKENEGVARYIVETPTATNTEPMKLVVSLTEEAVRRLHHKFMEYNLDVPMVRVMFDGKVKQQPAASVSGVSGADKKPVVVCIPDHLG